MPRLPPSRGARGKSPAPPDHPHVALADAYIDDVLTGRRPACKWGRLACERYRRDREREKERASPYRFDPAKAERVCRFIELLPALVVHGMTPHACPCLSFLWCRDVTPRQERQALSAALYWASKAPHSAHRPTRLRGAALTR